MQGSLSRAVKVVTRASRAVFPPVAVSAALLQISSALADPPPRMMAPHALIGVWAGERMICRTSSKRLHVYRRERIFHPVIFENEIGYACQVLNVRGRKPSYRLHLQCASFGKGRETGRHPAIQTAQLQEAGRRMRIAMWDARTGDPLRQDHLYRCRDIDTPHRRPRRTAERTFP